jgi:hypothetical protein
MRLGGLGRAEVATMHDLRRNLLVLLSGIVSTVVCGHLLVVSIFLGFENPNPPIFARLAFVWLLLLLIPSVGVGYFATRVPMLQSATVFLAGSVIVTKIDFPPILFARSIVSSYGRSLAPTRDLLVGVTTACILAYVGIWVRRLVRKRRVI